MKIKVSEATTVQLDWLVAKCEGHTVEMWHKYKHLRTPQQELVSLGVSVGECDEFGLVGYSPTSEWSQGGPIIEREGINVYQMHDGTWQANLDYGMIDEAIYHGPTPLIAAMRCFVASELGDEADVPDELGDQT